MFKSAFARDLACDLRTSASQEDSFSSFKSQFASEHQTFGDNYQSVSSSDLAIEYASSHSSHRINSPHRPHSPQCLSFNSLEEFRKQDHFMLDSELWKGLGALSPSVETEPLQNQKQSDFYEKTTTDTVPGQQNTKLDSSTFQALRQV